jgi:hypothetical protein
VRAAAFFLAFPLFCSCVEGCPSFWRGRYGIAEGVSVGVAREFREQEQERKRDFLSQERCQEKDTVVCMCVGVTDVLWIA